MKTTARTLMSLAAVSKIMFGTYLVWYGTVVISSYTAVGIPEAETQDSHGMSLLVGYSFIRMQGIIVLGTGLLAWFSKSISDLEAQKATTLGLFVTNALAFMMAIVQQISIWKTGWGSLHVAIFLLLTSLFGYLRFLLLRDD